MGGRVINLFTGSGVLRESINITVHFPSPRKDSNKIMGGDRAVGHANHTGHEKYMQTDSLNILPQNSHCIRSDIERENRGSIYQAQQCVQS